MEKSKFEMSRKIRNQGLCKEAVNMTSSDKKDSFNGIGASKGVGIGKVVVIKESRLSYTSYTPESTENELSRFEQAKQEFLDKTMAMADKLRQNVGDKEAEIVEGQIAMLSDPMVSAEMEAAIKSGKCCEDAVTGVCDTFIAMFSAIEDEMMRQRASDILDIKTRFVKILIGDEEIDISAVPAGTVLVARDLTPSMTSSIVKENVVGIATETGGRTSHSAILARALEIPAVLSVANFYDNVKDGQDIIVDGNYGTIILDPSAAERELYQSKAIEYYEYKRSLQQYIGKKTMTADGKEVELFGNIGRPQDIDSVLEYDGEGIGLFRTEFLFMDKTTIPSEEEQFQAYKQAVEMMKGGTVIIRTLDVGGDKYIPYLDLEKEENPFLGFRAIRVCLEREDVYKPQLRALLRASAFGDIRIMVPMVSCVNELRSVRKLVKEYMQELEYEKKAYNKEIKIGIMIETPAACAIADILAKEADFFSIGTNDLTQYTMAVDRGNSKVAYLYSAYNPAVIRLIKRVIECANQEKIPVGMCGEAAADPMLIPILLAFGLDEFSVGATSILGVRKTIAEVNMDKAHQIAEKVLQVATKEEVFAILKDATEK